MPILGFLPQLLLAQCDGTNWEALAQNATLAGEPATALAHWQQAKRCDPARAVYFDQQLVMVRVWERQLRRADSLAQRQASLLTEKNKTLNQLYFYLNRYGLAGSEGNYYFIDKKGNPAIRGLYAEATAFDATGFARVKAAGQYFLVDTAGVEYRLATELNDLSDRVTALDLRNRNLDSFPAQILAYPQLKVLLLGENYLKRLPADLNRLTNLEVLNLTNNFLAVLPDSLGALRKLRELNLAKNELALLPESLGQLTELRKITLDGNLLRTLPAGIVQLPQLRYLFASSNQLQTLPANWAGLKKIIGLDLSFNQLTQLPPALGQLASLRDLRLNNNRLTNLPEELSNLAKLEILLLNQNQLRNLPTTLGKLRNLRQLYLYQNQLSALPSGLDQLTQLENVVFSPRSGLYAEQIIAALANLPQPSALSVGWRTSDKFPELLRITIEAGESIPANIGSMRNLMALEWSNGRLDSLPASFGQLSQLKYLDLHSNRLTRLPASLGQCRALEFLSLASNRLDSLPATLGELSSLQTLFLGSNRLRHLPASLGQLRQLRRLDLYDNQLTVLPKELAGLIRLEELLLQDNQLRAFEGSLRTLTKLQSLPLYGNPALGLSAVCRALEGHPKPLQLVANGLKVKTDPLFLLVEINTPDSLPADLSRLERLLYLGFYPDSLRAIAPEVLKLDPAQIDFGELAYARFLVKDFAGAYAIARQHVEKRPQHFPALFQWAEFGLLAREFASTIAVAKRALALQPDLLELHSILALAHLCNNEWPKALAVLKSWRSAERADYSAKFVEQVQKDLQFLEENGITHPDFARLRTQLVE